jgi:hypothetical protein
MKLISIAALAVALTFTALPAQAEWQSEVEKDDMFAVGWVYDTTDKVQLSVDCSLFEASVALISDEQWDAAANYPETVPVRVVIDDSIVAEAVFKPENASGNLGIAAYEFEAAGVYEMILAMGMANEKIEVSFLDQTLNFTADKVFDAVSTVNYACDY